MIWRDRGILLSSRNHGETSAILEVFTSSHGRHFRGPARRHVQEIQASASTGNRTRRRMACEIA